jgi:Polyketide cyclase / dehydrase and lipid transport.
MYPSRTISLAIARPYELVYAFLCDPRNLDRWTNGVLEAPVEPLGGRRWRTRFSGQEIVLTMTPPNPYGVLDLTVTGPKAPPRICRARLFPNGGGCEICFTLIQHPDEDDGVFASEAEWVRTDLVVLKTYLESL